MAPSPDRATSSQKGRGPEPPVNSAATHTPGTASVSDGATGHGAVPTAPSSPCDCSKELGFLAACSRRPCPAATDRPKAHAGHRAAAASVPTAQGSPASSQLRSPRSPSSQRRHSQRDGQRASPPRWACGSQGHGVSRQESPCGAWTGLAKGEALAVTSTMPRPLLIRTTKTLS